jgi:hypothetical protein
MSALSPAPQAGASAAPINPVLAAALAPPVMEARRWIAGRTFPADRPLLNLSQAAPVDPPPEALRRAIAEAALTVPEAHLYGPVLGDPALRDASRRALVGRLWRRYRGGDVAITSGCNQAFCAALATLAGPGDEVILPTPWYFNHRMWLDMAERGHAPSALRRSRPADPEAARALIGPRPAPGAGHAQQPHRRGIRARADRRLLRPLPRGRDRAGPRRDLSRLPRRRGPAHGLFARSGLARHADPSLQLLQGVPADRPPRRRADRGAGAWRRPRSSSTRSRSAPTGSARSQRWRGCAPSATGWRASGARSSRAAPRWRRASPRAPAAGACSPAAPISPMSSTPSTRQRRRREAPGRRAVAADPARNHVRPRRAEGGDGAAERTLRIAFANADAGGLAETLRRLRAFGG